MHGVTVSAPCKSTVAQRSATTCTVQTELLKKCRTCRLPKWASTFARKCMRDECSPMYRLLWMCLLVWDANISNYAQHTRPTCSSRILRKIHTGPLQEPIDWHNSTTKVGLTSPSTVDVRFTIDILRQAKHSFSTSSESLQMVMHHTDLHLS